MNNSVKIMLILSIVAGGLYFFNKNQYNSPPINFNGEIYEFSSYNEINGVVNKFFTINGADAEYADKYIQISDWSSPDVSSQNATITAQQAIKVFNLKPFNGKERVYFSMFQNEHPIYAILTDYYFAFYVVSSGFESDKEVLLSEATQLLDEMDDIYYQPISN